MGPSLSKAVAVHNSNIHLIGKSIKKGIGGDCTEGKRLQVHVHKISRVSSANDFLVLNEDDVEVAKEVSIIEFEQLPLPASAVDNDMKDPGEQQKLANDNDTNTTPKSCGKVRTSPVYFENKLLKNRRA